MTGKTCRTSRKSSGSATPHRQPECGRWREPLRRMGGTMYRSPAAYCEVTVYDKVLGPPGARLSVKERSNVPPHFDWISPAMLDNDKNQAEEAASGAAANEGWPKGPWRKR